MCPPWAATALSIGCGLLSRVLTHCDLIPWLETLVQWTPWTTVYGRYPSQKQLVIGGTEIQLLQSLCLSLLHSSDSELTLANTSNLKWVVSLPPDSFPKWPLLNCIRLPWASITSYRYFWCKLSWWLWLWTRIVSSVFCKYFYCLKTQLRDCHIFTFDKYMLHE